MAVIKKTADVTPEKAPVPSKKKPPERDANARLDALIAHLRKTQYDDAELTRI